MTRSRANRWLPFIGLGCLLFSSTGCAGFWDEVLSSERDWNYVFNYNKPSPMTVIQKNPDGRPGSDGQRRGEAFSLLREPLQNGGDAKDQDAYLNILGTAVMTDSDYYCRLTAIRALGRFKDPRAARLLEEVYQLPVRRPGVKDDGRVLYFTADYNRMIRKEALVGLEKIHNEESRHLFRSVARQPGPQTTADLADREQTQDEKIVATRALGHYRQPDCVETLQYILKSEKDVCLRNCAKESLEEATGKRWPLEIEAWQAAEVQPLPPETAIQKAAHWIPRP